MLSQSFSRCRKRACDLVKIENRSGKRSHKLQLDVIGFWKIRTFQFLLIPFTTLSHMIEWKLSCQSWKQKRKNQPIARPRIEYCWFCLRLRQCSFHLIISDKVISRTQCSASNSADFSRLLSTTPAVCVIRIESNICKVMHLSMSSWWWGGREAGHRAGFWHFPKYYCQIPYPLAKMWGQI